jgi:hypothetical protein
MESEAFLLGIWKSYDELEASISLPELFATLKAQDDRMHEDREFFAKLNNFEYGGKPKQEKQAKAPATWEDIQARVLSGGKAKDSKDVLSLVGENARSAGIGIGSGLAYADENSKTEWWKDL